MNVLFNNIPGVVTVQSLTPYEVETSADGKTTWTRYSDGMVLKDAFKKLFEEKPTIIFRKTEVAGEGGTTVVRYEKTLAKWADRKAATTRYVPVNTCTAPHQWQ